MARIDYDKMAPDYDRGRVVPPEALADLRAALADYLPPVVRGPVLDLGSGTGTFAVLLARWFGVDVVGVEPSAGMRAEALEHAADPLVSYLGGCGEDIPLRPCSCAAAWLAHMVHHVDDLARCAVEVRRVVVGGGCLLIRGAFPERFDDLLMFKFFPAAAKAVEGFPTIETTIRAFESAGFRLEKLMSVPQETASSLADYLEKVRTRADTSLTLISDEEFDNGLRALEDAAAREAHPGPVIDYLDLLVMR